MFGIDRLLDAGLRQAVRSMTAALRHRGPDGEGFHDHPQVALGHRRLAIIDVLSGHQPIANEDGNVWVVFNGEIYNHSDLRRELVSMGHRFRTRTDTETIVHAYEQFGPECVERFDGMFAFAIYDARRRELFMARDRLGKKPLFYALLQWVLHFASELPALRHSPLWDDAQDERWLEEYLALGYIAAPRTAYKHVRKLEAGHWLLASAAGIRTARYWDITDFDTDLRPEAAILEELDGLLQDAVCRRLESEVPLGAFLSGGIDSGLVTSYLASASSTAPVTVSVGFGADGHNELAAAGVVAGALGTRHHAHLLQPDVITVVDQLLESFGEPFADPSIVPTFFVSRAARQDVTVALSGDGGDEAFAGYDFRYAPHAVESLARTLLPRSMRRVAGMMGEQWPRAVGLPRPLRLGTILENVRRDAVDAYFADLCVIKPPEYQQLLGRNPRSEFRDSAGYTAAASAYLACRSESGVQRAEYADMKVYLANGPLVKVDRMSMLNSLEVRCPLLDHRVIEFAFRLPAARKMPRLQGKYLLRRLAARRLPPQIAVLPKQGFTAPAGDWIAGPCAEQFRAEVLDRQALLAGHIDASVPRRYLLEHAEGRADRSYALWALWMAGRWMAAQRQPAAVH